MNTTYVRADEGSWDRISSHKGLSGRYINNEASTQTGNTTEDTTANITEDTELTAEEMLLLESDSLFSTSDPLLLTNSGAYATAYMNCSRSVSDNHGLRNGITFIKYEIEYNKYDSNYVEYIVIHDTGNTRNGADAMAHYQYFAAAPRDSSAHYFVDSTKVVQIIDDSEGSWHSGVKYTSYATPISNHNSIGIEMCINADGDYEQTVLNTVDLAAYLLYKYDLGINHLVRHFDANGKQCPMTMSANNWANWYEFVAAVRSKLAMYYSHGSASDDQIISNLPSFSKILGSNYLTADVLKQVLLLNNSSISEEDAETVADSYLTISKIYGVRGDVAFFQAMLETGYLNYGGEVDPSWHNYCGLKNEDGSGYAMYGSIQDGVEAHIQHLYCYASNDPIPEGREQLDPRFFTFLRGSVTCFEDLGGRWAVPGYDPNSYSSLEEAKEAHRSYGDIIVSLYTAEGGINVYANEGSSLPGEDNERIYTGAAAGARTILLYGQRGSDVKEIQGYLRTIGYSFVNVTGVYDDATLRAILDFQKRCELDADGAVGEDTWKWIINTYVSSVRTQTSVVDVSLVPSLEELKDPSYVYETPSLPDSSQVQETESKSAAEITGISVEGRTMVFVGSQGEDVRALQILLNVFEYGLDTDGIFGGGTERAVIDFQKNHQLDADGYVGPMTWKALGSARKETTGNVPVNAENNDTAHSQQQSEIPGTSNVNYDQEVIRFGSSGEATAHLQSLLNQHGASLEVDGIYGAATYNALTAFQTGCGLDPDGICGPLTWAALK